MSISVLWTVSATSVYKIIVTIYGRFHIVCLPLFMWSTGSQEGMLIFLLSMTNHAVKTIKHFILPTWNEEIWESSIFLFSSFYNSDIIILKQNSAGIRGPHHFTSEAFPFSSTPLPEKNAEEFLSALTTPLGSIFKETRRPKGIMKESGRQECWQYSPPPYLN